MSLPITLIIDESILLSRLKALRDPKRSCKRDTVLMRLAEPSR